MLQVIFQHRFKQKFSSKYDLELIHFFVPRILIEFNEKFKIR